MYPSLTSIGSGSRWYSKKQTPQENLMDITYMEQELARKRELATEVDVPIKIRGKATISNRAQKDDTMMEEDEEEEDLDADEMMLRQQAIEELEELNQDANYNNNNSYNSYNSNYTSNYNNNYNNNDNDNYNNEDRYNMYDPEDDDEEDGYAFAAVRNQTTTAIEEYGDYDNPTDN